MNKDSWEKGWDAEIAPLIDVEFRDPIKQSVKNLLATEKRALLDNVPMQKAVTDCKQCYIKGQQDYRNALLKEMEKE